MKKICFAPCAYSQRQASSDCAMASAAGMVRDFNATVLDDGSAAFSPATHQEAIAGLKPVARIATIAQVMAEIGA